jgi:hypothetical protein
VDAAAPVAAVVAVTFELAQKEELNVPIVPAFVCSSPQPSALFALPPTPALHRVHGNLKTE